jgi:hypothetical protein
MEDDEVDLYADPDKGQQAYFPKEEQEVRLLLTLCVCIRMEAVLMRITASCLHASTTAKYCPSAID